MQEIHCSAYLFIVFEGVVGSVKADKQPLLRLMIFTTDETESDWSSIFHHQANELRVYPCGGVISPSQLADSDRDGKKREEGGQKIEKEVRKEGMRDTD